MGISSKIAVRTIYSIYTSLIRYNYRGSISELLYLYAVALSSFLSVRGAYFYMYSKGNSISYALIGISVIP